MSLSRTGSSPSLYPQASMACMRNRQELESDKSWHSTSSAVRSSSRKLEKLLVWALQSSESSSSRQVQLRWTVSVLATPLDSHWRGLCGPGRNPGEQPPQIVVRGVG